ncbi:Hexaprenyldihydroxybenzoate methyltransferase, mitochondrial [Coemansia pectinata]|uniref:Ubiquinone biosynthesis O-methyltransferase, mitochondrial n=1 Tax=Coemansia pectinata TaxID=1052879 RepID=A0A9W8GWE5_9FUNG|nr:Hexaprenyldihydroxybenzoate methyltransferase, mitochondrial [Coemansia pectinata]
MSSGLNNFAIYQAHTGAWGLDMDGNPFDTAFNLTAADVKGLVGQRVNLYAKDEAEDVRKSRKTDIMLYCFEHFDGYHYGCKSFIFSTYCEVKFLIENKDSASLNQLLRECQHYWTSAGNMAITTIEHVDLLTIKTRGSRSVTASEVDKFIKDSAAWWDTRGPFKYLHTMNRTRTQFIRSHLADLSRLPASETLGREWIRGRRVVDVGCGGGLASESLARLGMRVLGVDAAKENVEMARIHAQKDPGLTDLEYVQSTAEQLKEKEAFDVVVSLEVIEHVADPMGFVKSLVDLAKPGASIFISTMNRTPVAAFVDVLVPEYLLNVVPRGTHDYRKFIKPQELSQMLSAVGAETLDTRGLILDPINNQCHLVERDYGLLRNIGVQANYILAARKTK